MGQMVKRTGIPNLTVVNLIAKGHWKLWHSHPSVWQQFQNDAAAWGWFKRNLPQYTMGCEKEDTDLACLPAPLTS